MRDFVMGKISRQLTVVVLLSLALSCLVYFTVQPILDRVICRYYEEHPQITYENTSNAMRSFQAYVEENDIKASDVPALNVWMKQQSVAILQVYRKNALLFDSTQHTSSGLHTHSTAHAHTVHETLYPVMFADGEASVALTVFPEYAVIQIANMVVLLFACALFLAIVLYCIRKKLRHFTRLENKVLSVAGGGDLHAVISIPGQDELSRLAECIDEMRRSLVGKIQREEARQQESYDWATALSHDLRTPLTMLTGYLEVIRRKAGTPEQETYIDKAANKAAQLKEMSDQLFACFSPNALQADACEAFPLAGLGDMLSECGLLLVEKGFSLALEPMPDGFIWAHPDALKRVIDNVFSNLLKYADVAVPIEITALLEAETCVLCVKSQAGAKTGAPSTGLGLVISRNLIENMGGSIETVQEQDMFVYRIQWKRAEEGASDGS